VAYMYIRVKKVVYFFSQRGSNKCNNFIDSECDISYILYLLYS